ncbi:biotin synthase BioB [Micrococcus luteus]|uniref:biotin synthase BioB n=1 Tax=Micrococcus luteus TaxID=1270 RepID=UPI001D0CA082|nr:biotin synthase BioB [Micrococcus luteus]MCC0767188.1 biotin synthase BioB [Micrococcus luteus]MCV7624691.1 biotin synthase BioB [Micrococcus luteus]
MTAAQDAAVVAPALDPEELVDRIEAGHRLTAAEAVAVLDAPDAETFRLVAAASRLRERHFGRTVKVNYLVSLKTGLCPEDCTYCSQRLGTEAQILKYTWLKPDEAVRQAGLGIAGGASRVCMVASGTGPTDRDVDRVTEMIGRLKDEHPQVEVCACLGKLKDGQAERLKAAGVDAYNHNLNTAESHYESICTSHTYADRVDTVERATAAGLSSCSGLIAGMGETHAQLAEAVLALRELDSDSIPVNFLMPFDGTPLAGHVQLTPLECLRILAVVRLACPDKELRIAAGREMHLRSLQAVGLQVANSIFLGDYLTSEGQDAEADLSMIADAGFTVLGAAAAPADDDGAPDGGCCGGGGCGEGGVEDASTRGGTSPSPSPAPRRRGAGTAEPANA